MLSIPFLECTLEIRLGVFAAQPDVRPFISAPIFLPHFKGPFSVVMSSLTDRYL